MRTLQLVKALDDSEIKEIEHALNDGKRKNLLLIFRYLKKMRGEERTTTVRELLKKVFAQKYSKPNELQLRNKLSRLNEILYRYVVLAEFKKQITVNRSLFNQWLAMAFRERNLPLFKNDIDGFIQVAISDFMLDEAIAMLRLNCIANLDNFENHLKNIAEWQLQDKRRWLLHIAVSENMKATAFEREATRTQKREAVFKHYTPPDYHPNLTSLQHEWYFNVYENARKALMSNSPEEKIEFLSKAQMLMKEKQPGHVLFRGTQANILANMAHVFMTQAQFEKADKYLLKYLQLQQSSGIKLTATFWVNYLVNLSWLGRLSDVENVYRQNKLLLEDSPYKSHINILYCAACIFNGHADTVLKTMTDATALDDHMKVMVRNLYIVLFIMRKDYTLARNEIHNLKRSIVGYTSTETLRQLVETTELLSDFVAVFTSKTKHDVRKEAFRAKLQSLMAVPANDPVHKMILNWLTGRLSRGFDGNDIE